MSAMGPGWVRVVFAADCDDDGNCPNCHIDYADCGCVEPYHHRGDHRTSTGETWPLGGDRDEDQR